MGPWVGIALRPIRSDLRRVYGIVFFSRPAGSIYGSTSVDTQMLRGGGDTGTTSSPSGASSSAAVASAEAAAAGGGAAGGIAGSAATLSGASFEGSMASGVGGVGEPSVSGR